MAITIKLLIFKEDIEVLKQAAPPDGRMKAQLFRSQSITELKRSDKFESVHFSLDAFVALSSVVICKSGVSEDNLLSSQLFGGRILCSPCAV